MIVNWLIKVVEESEEISDMVQKEYGREDIDERYKEIYLDYMSEE